jgi:nicotinamidase-related amidase
MPLISSQDPYAVLADAFNRRALAHMAVDFQRRYKYEDTAPAFAAGKDFSEVCRAHHVPNIWVAMTRDGGAITPNSDNDFDTVAPLPEEKTFIKQYLSAFSNPDLDPCLKRSGIDTLVASGLNARVCLLASVNEAVDKGYRVALATDATNFRHRQHMDDYGDRVLRVTTTGLSRMLNGLRPGV